MPNLPVHIQLAVQAADQVGASDLHSNLGYFCLGSTSPDIRAITKRARSEYHFVELDFKTIGEGVNGMFAAYPDLMDAAEHDGATRAFVAGYIAHLLTDETYIVRMFRPYFGEAGVFEDPTLAKVFDRALQLDLDRQVWEDVQRTVAVVDMIPGNVSVRFLPQSDLAAWTEWVHRVVEGGFSWERLRFMARRITALDAPRDALRHANNHPAYEHAERFLDSVPESLKNLYDLVPKSRIDEFKFEVTHTVAVGLREYLS